MKKVCSIEGCDALAVSRGMCQRHYGLDYYRRKKAESKTEATKTAPLSRLPVLTGPIFSSTVPTQEEWEFKKELIASTIRLYEEDIKKRRLACHEKLREKGPKAVLEETARIDADAYLLQEYKWQVAVMEWMEKIADPAFQKLPVLEKCEHCPIPNRSDYGLPDLPTKP